MAAVAGPTLYCVPSVARSRGDCGGDGKKRRSLEKGVSFGVGLKCAPAFYRWQRAGRGNLIREQSRISGIREAKVGRSISVRSAQAAVEKDGTEEYDAIVIGSGMGGLVAATQLAIRNVKVLLLEKYIIPGGSSGYFKREGYTFDVGSSVMFGFSEKGNINLVTRALAAVGRKMELIPDPTTVHYHLPNDFNVQVHRKFEDFLNELYKRFPEERAGIDGFFGECWRVFNALNALELKSLEEPLYLFGQFFKNPAACLTLAYYLPQNAGAIARKHIKDPELLSYIDAECFIVSTVDAMRTPMINCAMVICDRHYGGINYPVGGVGGIAVQLAEGLVEKGGQIQYKANVKSIILENEKAVSMFMSTRVMRLRRLP